MVYDGVPTFISGNSTESRLLGTFCGYEENLDPIRTETSTVTIYFEIDMGKVMQFYTTVFSVSKFHHFIQ